MNSYIGLYLFYLERHNIGLHRNGRTDDSIVPIADQQRRMQQYDRLNVLWRPAGFWNSEIHLLTDVQTG